MRAAATAARHGHRLRPRRPPGVAPPAAAATCPPHGRLSRVRLAPPPPGCRHPFAARPPAARSARSIAAAREGKEEEEAGRGIGGEGKGEGEGEGASL
jgi:hypothetical protein